MRLNKIAVVVFLFTLTLPAFATKATLQGKIVKVKDGDTVVVSPVEEALRLHNDFVLSQMNKNVSLERRISQMKLSDRLKELVGKPVAIDDEEGGVSLHHRGGNPPKVVMVGDDYIEMADGDIIPLSAITYIDGKLLS